MTHGGPYEPLEKRLGSRAAFEAHQKSEAERTARVPARRREARREVLVIVARTLLIIAVIGIVIYLIGGGSVS